MTGVKDKSRRISSTVSKESAEDRVEELEEVALPIRNGATPLPRLQMTILSIVIICEPIIYTIIFPFMYPMVQSFNVSDDEKEIGRYTGWIASSFSIAQFCTIMIWGRVSDLIGRRPVLLVGLMGNSVTTCLFGLSKSYWWAISMRALCGIMNSNAGVIRTILGEITDMSNKGEAFSIYSICWTTGIILGPAIGGYFVNPAEQLPWFFNRCQFLIKYPFFLPCFLSSLLSFTGFMLGYFYLEETNPYVIDKKQSQIDERARLLSKPQNQMSKPIFKMKLLKNAIFVIFSQCLLVFSDIVFGEVLPLYAISPSSASGLDISSKQFAAMWCSVGIVGIVYRLTLLPWASRRYDSIKLLAVAYLSLLIGFVCFPALTSIKYWLMINVVNDTLRSLLFTLYFIIGLHFYNFALCIAFPSIMVMVNLSATPETIGLVNSVCQTCLSLISILAPPFGGNIWSWSIKGDRPYPLGHHFIFYIEGLVALIGFLECFIIPKRLAYLKKTY